LTQHIPPKGKHLIRYYGLYSSRTTGKNNAEGKLEKFKNKAIVEIQKEDKPEEAKAGWKKSNKTWARLIQKVFEVDPVFCPKLALSMPNVCGKDMKITAIITDPLSVNCILRYLEKNNLPPFDLPKTNSPPGRLALSA
jgi:hypothetical protein